MLAPQRGHRSTLYRASVAGAAPEPLRKRSSSRVVASSRSSQSPS